jgi:hypothetical protein
VLQVLLVVGVQQQDQVHRLDDVRAGLVLRVGHREQHVQEVGDVAELRVG